MPQTLDQAIEVAYTACLNQSKVSTDLYSALLKKVAQEVVTPPEPSFLQETWDKAKNWMSPPSVSIPTQSIPEIVPPVATGKSAPGTTDNTFALGQDHYHRALGNYADSPSVVGKRLLDPKQYGADVTSMPGFNEFMKAPEGVTPEQYQAEMGRKAYLTAARTGNLAQTGAATGTAPRQSILDRAYDPADKDFVQDAANTVMANVQLANRFAESDSELAEQANEQLKLTLDKLALVSQQNPEVGKQIRQQLDEALIRTADPVSLAQYAASVQQKVDAAGIPGKIVQNAKPVLDSLSAIPVVGGLAGAAADAMPNVPSVTNALAKAGVRSLEELSTAQPAQLAKFRTELCLELKLDQPDNAVLQQIEANFKTAIATKSTEQANNVAKAVELNNKNTGFIDTVIGIMKDNPAMVGGIAGIILGALVGGTAGKIMGVAGLLFGAAGAYRAYQTTQLPGAQAAFVKSANEMSKANYDPANKDAMMMSLVGQPYNYVDPATGQSMSGLLTEADVLGANNIYKMAALGFGSQIAAKVSEKGQSMLTGIGMGAEPAPAPQPGVSK